MKPLWIVAGLVSVVVVHQLLIAPTLDSVAGASLGEEARLALDLRCGEPTHTAARECRERLERLYASGSLDPERTLRAYCAEVKSAPWGRSHPAPPRACVERYGM